MLFMNQEVFLLLIYVHHLSSEALIFFYNSYPYCLIHNSHLHFATDKMHCLSILTKNLFTVLIS